MAQGGYQIEDFVVRNAAHISKDEDKETGEVTWNILIKTAKCELDLMTIDKQEVGHYAEVRRWHRENGDPMLIYFSEPESLLDEEALVDVQKSFGLLGTQVGINHDHASSQVEDMCSRHGWIAMRGSAEPLFLHKGKKRGGKSFRKPYSQLVKLDPDVGRHNRSEGKRAYNVYLLHWSNPPSTTTSTS